MQMKNLIRKTSYFSTIPSQDADQLAECSLSILAWLSEETTLHKSDIVNFY